MEFSGRSAVITGGGNGIGRAIAIALAREGANVAVADVEQDAAESVASEVEALGAGALAAQVDVTREEDLERLADKAWSAFGSVELLFNNAGVGAGRAPAYGFSADDVRWILGVNVEGVLNGIRVFAPRFIEGGRESRIMNTGSEHSLGIPFPGSSVYTASKHAVLAISDVLRAELPDHVGVSVFCPGWVATSIWRSSERRPEHLGGPQEANPTAGRISEENAMSADEAAAMVLQQIREDRFYLLTHPHVIEYARTRWEDIEAAFTEQAPRYEGDDRYDVTKAIARIRAQRGG